MSAEERQFQGEPAVALSAGGMTAVFLPHLGMTGVSLEYRDREHLALPGGLDALRAGHTLGLPLLAPWANRLGAPRYQAGGVTVDLEGIALHTDTNGLPIHGLLVGASGWQVDRFFSQADTATMRASIGVDSPAFPFPHRIEVVAVVRDAQLTVATSVIPTGDRPVPVAFGWHPYLQLPGTPREHWHLRLPARQHVALDARGLPTGAEAPEAGETDPIGRRTFDDLYALASDRDLALVAQGDAFTARFTLALRAPAD